MNLGDNFVTPTGKILKCIKMRGMYPQRRQWTVGELCMDCTPFDSCLGLPDHHKECENRRHLFCWSCPSYDFEDVYNGLVIKNVKSLVGWRRANCVDYLLGPVVLLEEDDKDDK